MRTREETLLKKERSWLRRMHRRAVKLRGLGYTVDGIARELKVTSDDAWELLKEPPC